MLKRRSQGFKRAITTMALLVILIVLAGCNRPGADPGPTASPTVGSLPVPTASPEPEISQVFLYIGDDGVGNAAERVEDRIASLSADAGYDFVVQSSFTENALDQNVKIAFFLANDPGIAALAARFSSTQFVAIGINDLNEAANLTRIGPEGFRADQVGFISGMLAASVTPNWRVGAVSLLNDSEDSMSNSGFQNGAKFYCGLCRPAYPPFNPYPVGIEASATDLAAVRESVSSLLANDVDTVFLSPALSEAATLDMSTGANVYFIGGESPAETLGDLWIATVRAAPELAIEEIWEKITRSEGGESLPMPIVIEDINAERLTPGRETWLLENLQDLIDGYIDTGVDPNTGIVR